MATATAFSPKGKTALLVLDVQAGFVTRAKLTPNYLPLFSKTIDAARAADIKVIYMTVAFRPGHPEIVLRNAPFALAVKTNTFVSGSPETAVDAIIAPKDGDVLVEKKRVSAFTGSGLDVVLRGLGVEHLVLAGMSTGGVVLSTVCDAADRDFGITVLRDLCTDADLDLHNTLMDKIFSKRGDVIEAGQWLESLAS
jgi:nicotinamidase-related amidase